MIRLDISGNAVINGSVLANGNKGINHGGGSGGGIFIRSVGFHGGPLAQISAKGGDGNTDKDGAGGGGRIAVWYGRSWETEPAPADLIISETPPPTFLGTLSVDPGQVSFTNDSEPGTIRFVTIRKPLGTVISIR